MKAQTGAVDVKSGGRVSVESGTRQVSGTGTEFADDDVSREITLGGDVYRIASVAGPGALTLAHRLCRRHARRGGLQHRRQGGGRALDSEAPDLARDAAGDLRSARFHGGRGRAADSVTRDMVVPLPNPYYKSVLDELSGNLVLHRDVYERMRDLFAAVDQRRVGNIDRA